MTSTPPLFEKFYGGDDIYDFVLRLYSTRIKNIIIISYVFNFVSAGEHGSSVLGMCVKSDQYLRQYFMISNPMVINAVLITKYLRCTYLVTYLHGIYSHC